MAKANNPKSNQNSSVTNQVRQIKIHTKKAEINNTETDTLEAFIGLRLNANETKKFEQVKTLLPQFKTKGNKGEDDYNKSGAMKEIMNFFLDNYDTISNLENIRKNLNAQTEMRRIEVNMFRRLNVLLQDKGLESDLNAIDKIDEEFNKNNNQE